MIFFRGAGRPQAGPRRPYGDPFSEPNPYETLQNTRFWWKSGPGMDPTMCTSEPALVGPAQARGRELIFFAVPAGRGDELFFFAGPAGRGGELIFFAGGRKSING